MKKLFILIFLPINFVYLFAMEAPLSKPQKPKEGGKEQEIPAEIKFKYDQEKKKFASYNLQDPSQVILKRLQAQLKKNENLIEYLQHLSLFASKLLLQHIILKRAAVTQYLNRHADHLDELINQGHERLGTKKSTKGLLAIAPETTKQLNEILRHIGIVKTTHEFNPEEFKVVFSWTNDPSYGKWLNGYAALLILGQDLIQFIKASQAHESNNIPIELLQLDIPKDPQKKIRFIQENTEYFNETLSNMIELCVKQKKLIHLGASEQLAEEYNKKEQKLSDLYMFTHDWYEQLYEIIYTELKSSLLELLKQTPTYTIQHLLRTFPEQIVKEFPKEIPAILPAKLPPLGDPTQVIIVPSIYNAFIMQIKELKSQQQSSLVKETKPQPTLKQIKKISAVPVQPLKEPIQEPAPAPGQSILSIEKTKEEEKPLETIQKLKEGSDKSFIITGQETDKNIIIHDPKNNTTITLFKTDNPSSITQKLPAKNYTDWVQMWFKHPDQALQVQGYTTLNSPKFTAVSEYWRPIAIHSFPLLVDDYIMQWGTLAKIPSRRDKTRQDFLVTIPGMMKYPNGKEETGVFAYLIDSNNGQWYHRMFEPQSGTKLISDLFELGYFSPQMKGYYDVYFPPLGKK